MRWGILGSLIHAITSWWNLQQGYAFRCSFCRTIQSNGFKYDDGRWECLICTHAKGKVKKKCQHKQK